MLLRAAEGGSILGVPTKMRDRIAPGGQQFIPPPRLRPYMTRGPPPPPTTALLILY